jgi:hypothetical protein
MEKLSLWSMGKMLGGKRWVWLILNFDDAAKKKPRRRAERCSERSRVGG